MLVRLRLLHRCVIRVITACFLALAFSAGDFDPIGWSCPTGDTCDVIYSANSATLEISSPGSLSPTPEPSALILFGTGSLVLDGYLWRKRAAVGA